MSLFEPVGVRHDPPPRPLAEEMRPSTLDDCLGQERALSILRAFIAQGSMPSILLWGPPGTGKTTISRIMASLLGWEGRSLNATSASVKDVREMAEEAKQIWAQLERRTLLFVDEIHRLNKARQDVLLPFVEQGTFVLAGSTTENPAFSVNQALRSRLQTIRLEPLEVQHIEEGLKRAAERLNIEMLPEAATWIARRVSGDLRAAYTVLESAWLVSQEKGAPIDAQMACTCLDKTMLSGGRSGDNHFDLASAYQKSMRGSDAHAAVYYLGRFLETGEDPRFIARRLLVTASEDVGNADPNAFALASNAFAAVERLGLPECRIPLAQATIYVAQAPKSNQAVAAIGAAVKHIQENPEAPVPPHLRDSHYASAKDLGHGVGYIYSHNQPDAPQGFLPEQAVGRQFVPDLQAQADAHQAVGSPQPQTGQPKPKPKAAPATADQPQETVEKVLAYLQQEYPGSDGFELDMPALAQQMDMPEKTLRACINQLVQAKRLGFRRVFHFNSA